MTVDPQIFVVHGALGSAKQMEPIAQALRSLGRVHNVELPGHGNTDVAQRDFSMSTFVDALREAVSHNDAAVKPLVFGYSMGGYVALTLETQHPGTFSGILTLGTKFAWTPDVAARESSRLDANVIAEKVPKFAAVLEERHANAGGWKAVLQRTAGVLTELGSGTPLTRESLSRIQARTCIALGGRDDTMTVDEAREYAGFIPGATFELLEDTPHPIERVSSDAIVTLVQSNFR